MEKTARIYVAGHQGLVGSALCRQLQVAGFTQLITRTHAELDLTDTTAVNTFFAQMHPDYVLLAAAKVGGIQANQTYPAEFIYQNLMIATNVIHAAYRYSVKRLLFLGSSCIYPRLATQPMREEALLTGLLEPTNEPYAIAKIAGIKLCESYNRQYHTDYRSVMPTNLYGTHDNFDLETSHVIPALIRKFHEAKVYATSTVSVWGSGSVRREFLHVDDLAHACLHIMGLDKMPTQSMHSHLNIGTGEEVTIRELAELVKTVVGFEGTITFDTTQPDGTPRKLLDVSRLTATGWQPRIDLQTGLKMTYQWYLTHFYK